MNRVRRDGRIGLAECDGEICDMSADKSRMTKIEKAVRAVSDLYDFYRRIPKVRSGPKQRGHPDFRSVTSRKK